MNDDRKFEWLLRLASTFQAYTRQQLAQGEAAPLQPSSRSQSLDATIVSSPGKVAELTALAQSLGGTPGMLAHSFFQASVSLKNWRPCVVVVSQGQRTIGLLYCKERTVVGVRARIAVGDDSLGAMVVADPSDAESVICCGVRALLKRMVGLRLLLPFDRLPFLTGIQAYADVNFFPAMRHAHLALPRTYEEFLVRLGPHIRRNFRYYRRKSEQAGNEFILEQAFADFRAVARQLFPKAVYATSKRDLDNSLAMIEAMPSPVLAGIRRRDGEWISVIGGWLAGDRAIVNMQLNDRTYGRESVSLVMRSYLIEALIHRGSRELVFWQGTARPLRLYSAYPQVFIAHIDARSMPWRLCRMACRAVNRLAPASLGKWLREKWIVPDGERVP
jgi:hypothetical protein